MSGTPVFWAQMLREQAGLKGYVPLDVEALARWCRIRIDEAPLDGFLGLYMDLGDRRGMLLKEGQDVRQRRFTIAHEIGHFAIPTHSGRSVEQCLEEDVLGGNSTNPIEAEANQFAAELLMPRAVFNADIRNKTPSFGHIPTLADRYDVSVTACALRWVELSDERVALICVEGDRVKWKRLSKKLRYSLRPSGNRIAPECVAAAVQRGEGRFGTPEVVPPWAWLERPPDRTEVLESTFALPRLNQVLALILVDDEVDEED